MEKIEDFFKEKTRNSSVDLKLSKPRKGKGYKILIGLLIIGLVSVSIYYFYQYEKIKNNPGTVTQEESNTLLAKVGKIMELPQDETPTIATVSDKDKLKDQDFFKSSENGDKILIYANYKMAILYRPSANKIIKVAPLVMDQSSASQNDISVNKPISDNQPSINQNSQNNSPVPSDEQSMNNPQQGNLNVVIYNGTKIAGLAKEIQDKITNIEGISIGDTGDAKKNNYTKTEIIDLTNKNTELVNKIVQAVNGEAVSLPDGEVAPENVDILIIAGK